VALVNRPPRREPEADQRHQRHPNGKLYRYAVEDCALCQRAHRMPQWAEAPKCTAEDGEHLRTCEAHRVYVPEVVNLREVR
jgi:hypothetical protein